MIHALYEPWLFDEEFEFTSDYVAKTWRMMITENTNKFRMNLPKDWLFTNRLQWGLYAVLAALGARSNWRRRLLPLLYRSGENHPVAFRHGLSVD
jgi:hypothetical protein